MTAVWWGDDRQRALFEWRARGLGTAFVREWDGKHLSYVLPVEVPCYGGRIVQVQFSTQRALTPLVHADGPTSSKHRFKDGALCMWVPDAPRRERWIVQDGLYVLKAMSAAHLFREAYWREYDTWLGPEQPHGEVA